MTKKDQNKYPTATLTGYIEQLIDKLESQHSLFLAEIKSHAHNTKNSKKILSVITKNSESIILFREQIQSWKKKTLSQSQQQTIKNVEQKLSKAMRLNAKLSELVDVKV